jgi:hypothetical protein
VEDVPGHVRQSEVAAGVAIGQALVVEPQEMEDRRVVVVDVNGVAHNGRPVVVRLPVTAVSRQVQPSLPGPEP